MEIAFLTLHCALPYATPQLLIFFISIFRAFGRSKPSKDIQKFIFVPATAHYSLH
jgi:hypothetical protein